MIRFFSDNFEGAYEATKHLIELGHANIGIILEIREIRSFTDRLAGYKKALKEADIEIRKDYIKQSGLEVEGAYTAARSLLEDCPEVTAIFSTNNLVTRGVLQYFKENGTRCPEDVSLVGFDDPDWAASFSPSITSVAQQPYAIGYKAAELLFSKVNKSHSAEEWNPHQISLKTGLKLRESSLNR